MKSALTRCVIIGLLACGQAAAEGITVTKPAAGDNWPKGTSHPITWTMPSYFPMPVSITLVNPADTATVKVITNSTSNTGSYQWASIPADIPAGSYRIKLAIFNTASGTSGIFTISEPAGSAIKVTAPNGGESWQAGTAKQITWSPGSATGNVRIELYRNGTAAANKIGVINASVAASAGSCAWTVGTCQGCPAQTGSGYKVMVIATTPALKDASDGPFTITPQGQGGVGPQPGAVAAAAPALSAAGVQAATPVAPIRILDPKHDTKWTVGMPGTVRWEAKPEVKYPLWLFLVTADHMPVMDMGKFGSQSNRVTQAQWTVTDNIYDGQYCVRITSADNVQYHSQAFTIVATTYRTVTAPASEIVNRWKRRSWITQSTLFGDEFVSPPITAVPDPVGTVIKYGYQRWYQDGANHGWILHRSFVRFDLSAITASLKHKTTVISAAITWQLAPGSPQACDGAVLGLEAALPNLDALFGDAFTNFPKRLLAPNGDPNAVNQLVQQWLDDPQRNYGTIFYGPNQGQLEENGQCVEFAYNAVLKLQLEEKLTK